MAHTDRAQIDLAALESAFRSRNAEVAVIGLGYVGLPLVLALVSRGFPVTGFDIDPKKTEALNAGRSYIRQIGDSQIAAAVATERFHATTDPARLSSCGAIIICVPTPLSPQREPDLSFVVDTTRIIRDHLRPGQLIVLESTTYPGTTDDVVRPILEETGLKSGSDFFLAYSPEREDPGNIQFTTSQIPKVVGGDGDAARILAVALYDQVVPQTVPVSSTRAAEATKLTENIFRSVNIALVNELKIVYDAMGIDVWEVIDAAKTKPFGFMPFYPGPGLGGHCIPIDPFYLTWKAREYQISTRFIELAGEVNTMMPRYVIDRLALALDRHSGRGLNRSRILLVGMAYKKNVDDSRESPGLRLMEMLLERNAVVEYHDSYLPTLPTMREHPDLAGRRSVDWEPSILGSFDAAVIVTDHDNVDYEMLATQCPLIVDTRNAMRRVAGHNDRIIKA
ncbi:nucleotide sugar dehydrogenase [Azospirillum isscasi]|uniref:Nucleotide sugar dehydrogenase n=1 Tax=Azospirillum isscasi TaxID=3053926 RepID=A0ABU0WGJ8_9PROT|nr:nucleotide sugar dehydrogenase [Azospirillum isscasi]MDQ2103336.1 nucleotide sugar dehydrogenase [Azospirillum isscasi]